MDQGELNEEDQAVNQALDDAKEFMRVRCRPALSPRVGAQPRLLAPNLA